MAWWNRRSPEDVAEIAAQKVLDKAIAAISTPQGRQLLPQGTQTMTAQQAIHAAQTVGLLENPLPRNPMDARVPFGPATPLLPRPVDPNGPWGRPEPRRTEYPIAWNLQLTQHRAVPFELLKAAADQCDVVRRCIDIRKNALQEQDWDIALTATATAALMAADDTVKSPQKAQSIGRQKFSGVIDRIRDFLEEPDVQNGEHWSAWLGNLLEEHMVWDALSVYPVFDTVGSMVRGGMPRAFRILDGSTIKPLLDEYGNRPLPPYPAFQQILYGFPRGEFVAAPDPDAEFSADQLFYAPRDLRSSACWPYGSSPTEKSLPAADLWMRRQQWLAAEYDAGVIGRANVIVDQTFTEADRQQQESELNARMSGNTKQRQQYKLWPKVEFDYPPSIEQRYKTDYDEFLIKQIGSKFAVMPTQLGIVPNAYGVLGRGTEPGEQDISETLGDGPLEEWVIDVVNALCRRYLGMPKELTLTFTGGGIDEDAQVRAETNQVKLFSGQKTLNDIRAEEGDSLYEFPEADMPFINTASGPDFLEGASIPDPVPVMGPDGKPVPPKVGPDGKPVAPKPVAKPAPRDAATKKEAHLQKAEEADQFLTFARNRQGKAWRDFQFSTVTPSLAKALNAAGQRGDLEAIKAMAATFPNGETTDA